MCFSSRACRCVRCCVRSSARLAAMQRRTGRHKHDCRSHEAACAQTWEQHSAGLGAGRVRGPQRVRRRCVHCRLNRTSTARAHLAACTVVQRWQLDERRPVEWRLHAATRAAAQGPPA
jgi:hypothetical protein